MSSFDRFCNGWFDFFRPSKPVPQASLPQIIILTVLTVQIKLLIKIQLDSLYTDKLDGRITEEFWKEKHEIWYQEKDTLLNKLRILNNASKNFDEGSNLLSNFIEAAPRLYKSRNGKQKRQILSMLGSNFIYKDKKVSVELTSVFNYLLNNRFVKYGADDETRTRDVNLGKVAFYH